MKKRVVTYFIFVLIFQSGFAQNEVVEPLTLKQLLKEKVLNIRYPEYPQFIKDLNEAYENGTIESEVEERDLACIGHRSDEVLSEDKHIIAITKGEYQDWVKSIKKMFKTKYYNDYEYNNGDVNCVMDFQIIMENKQVQMYPRLLIDGQVYTLTSPEKCVRWTYVTMDSDQYQNEIMPWFTYLRNHNFRKEMLVVLEGMSDKPVKKKKKK